MRTEDNIYRIFEGNMERLEKKLKRIQNKCSRYGCDFTYEKIGEEFKTVTNKEGNLETIKMIVVKAEGKAIVNDWQFVATLEHTAKGNIIDKYATEIEVPERYYNCDAYCEHCKTKRRRKDTYIVYNSKTNEFKQVGRNCLCDFTHGLDASGVASYMSAFNELIKGEAPYEGCSYTRYYNLVNFLCNCKETVDIWGYRKADERKATYDMAFINMKIHQDERPYWWTDRDVEDKRRELESVNYNPSKHVDYVKKALEWLDAKEEDNNYIHNLKTACASEYVHRLSLVCSLIPTYDRDVAYQMEKRIREERRLAEQKAMQKSEHIGNIGDRITVNVEEWRCLASWDTQWGTTFMYQFKDTDGNVFIWKGSKYIDDDKEKFTIKGTVKEHGEFRDVKQTIITRCKVA